MLMESIIDSSGMGHGMSEDTRRDTLNSLIKFSKSMDDVSIALSELEFDCEEDVCELRRDDIINVLERYIADEISASDVERWADLIEMRDGIGYEEKNEDLIIATIQDLATPELSEELDKHKAERLIFNLR
jgi:hypothetical protein